tara:strand:- start:601 stop:792 length:192 start_codon:yes stop_codon:yes gene_type:complete
MINTDRYDPELWRDAEANLTADAPLLLAEVLRLREGIKELSEDWLRWDERGIKMAKILMELIG